MRNKTKGQTDMKQHIKSITLLECSNNVESSIACAKLK